MGVWRLPPTRCGLSYATPRMVLISFPAAGSEGQLAVYLSAAESCPAPRTKGKALTKRNPAGAFLLFLVAGARETYPCLCLASPYGR